ncbi:MAG: sensor histidine kinase [bacterium]
MKSPSINHVSTKISIKLICLLVLSALAPLSVYGIFSIYTSRKAYYQSASEGNKHVAIGTAEQIELYVKNTHNILQGLASNINRIYLNKWQKEVIIRNFVINFDEFKKISIINSNGREVASSSLDENPFDWSHEESFKKAMQGEVYFSEVFISDNLVPSMIIALPIKGSHIVDGVILGEVDLSAMWNLVDGIKMGENGVVFVVSRTGLLIAHGKSERKPDVFKQRNMSDFEVVKSVLQGKTAARTYQNEDGLQVLGIGYPMKMLGWGVIAEQPTREAYKVAISMTRSLSALTVLFLVIMITIGIIGGKQVTRPIYELVEATRAIAAGDLTRKVRVSSRDEFEGLANSFNLMTERLVELKEEIRLRERLSIFARIAAGLVHDLKHPIKNIENSSSLILRFYYDQEYREVFRKTVQREFLNINQFLNDLHNLTHPTPIALIELPVEAITKEIINLYTDEARQKGIELKFFSQAQDVRILADRFLFERIIKNLVTNAIEAMPGGGTVRITLTRDDRYESGRGAVRISVEDTGQGIPKERIDTIFTDYITTRKRGLGLGLAITKKNVSELGGSITLHSEEGKGSTFILTFPLRHNQ